MANYFKKAVDMLRAAKPASGLCPETPQEWDALLKANEELGYAILRDGGMSKSEARKFANQIYGGHAGRLLLEMSFKGNARV
jgi:hypothetical protein